MKIPREPKETDQEQARKATKMIFELMNMNPEIEGCMWIAGFGFVTARSLKKSGFTHEDFCKEMDKIKNRYASFWDEHEVG